MSPSLTTKEKKPLVIWNEGYLSESSIEKFVFLVHFMWKEAQESTTERWLEAMYASISKKDAWVIEEQQKETEDEINNLGDLKIF